MPTNLSPKSDPNDATKNRNNDDGTQHSDDTDASDEEPEKPRLNIEDELRKGIVKTKKNTLKAFTILIVGETGTGKTSLLSLIANVLAGHEPEQFQFVHDKDNEAGGGNQNSQTNKAKVYEFTSNNGVKVTILDTPGLADTRGIAQDELHKASIATAIKDSISTVNAVIILANGTVPRLGVATDYALSTLSSIFPRTLEDNIGILFTNVSNALSYNFDQKSLPDVLRGMTDNQWLLDNPLAMWRKYLEIKASGSANSKMLKQLRKSVYEGHKKALEQLVALFDWLDSLIAQPTKDILDLYNKSVKINNDIESAMARATQISNLRKQLSDLRSDVKRNELTMKQYEELQRINKTKIWDRENTNRHNTLCSAPNCYSNCHVPCYLPFSLEPEVFKECSAMGGGTLCSVSACGHSYDKHHHYNAIWKLQEVQGKIDPEAEKKYNKAKDDNNGDQMIMVNLDKEIERYDAEMEDALTSLGRLTESYAKLSLSGSFAGQVKKSVGLLEMNLKAMKENKADQRSIEMVEKSLNNMKEKLKVVEKAEAKRKGGVVKVTMMSMISKLF